MGGIFEVRHIGIGGVKRDLKRADSGITRRSTRVAAKSKAKTNARRRAKEANKPKKKVIRKPVAKKTVAKKPVKEKSGYKEYTDRFGDRHIKYE
jgi:hypothetical protein